MPAADRLFVAERLDGVEPGRLPRGIEPEGDADDDRDADRRQNGRNRQLRVPLDDPPYRQGAPAPQQDADQPAQEAEQNRLDQKLPENIPDRAPTAMRSPISRVRSVTETSLMLLTPIGLGRVCCGAGTTMLVGSYPPPSPVEFRPCRAPRSYGDEIGSLHGGVQRLGTPS